MRTGQASKTAEQNALFRALETARPRDQRLFEDPLARQLLTWPLSVAGSLGRLPGGRSFVPWYIDRRWRGVRPTVAARTLLIDDLVEAEVDQVSGAPTQLVLLGAGFDTRAHRLPALRGLTVFEVDHPDTQAAKRRSLARLRDDGVDDHVRYVASDFALDQLGRLMAAAGYDDTAPTILLWEGVSNYLTADAVDATMRWCAEAAAGSLLIFTYINADLLADPSRYVGTEQLFATLSDAGERFTFGLDPAELDGYLAERGLDLLTDVGAADFRAEAYGDEARTIEGHEFYRVATARVSG